MDEEERRQADLRTVNVLSKHYFTEAMGYAWGAAKFMPEPLVERAPSNTEIDDALRIVLRLRPEQIAQAVQRLKVQ